MLLARPPADPPRRFSGTHSFSRFGCRRACCGARQHTGGLTELHRCRSSPLRLVRPSAVRRARRHRWPARRRPSVVPGRRTPSRSPRSGSPLKSSQPLSTSLMSPRRCGSCEAGVPSLACPGWAPMSSYMSRSAPSSRRSAGACTSTVAWRRRGRHVDEAGRVVEDLRRIRVEHGRGAVAVGRVARWRGRRRGARGSRRCATSSVSSVVVVAERRHVPPGESVPVRRGEACRAGGLRLGVDERADAGPRSSVLACRPGRPVSGRLGSSSTVDGAGEPCRAWCWRRARAARPSAAPHRAQRDDGVRRPRWCREGRAARRRRAREAHVVDEQLARRVARGGGRCRRRSTRIMPRARSWSVASPVGHLVVGGEGIAVEVRHAPGCEPPTMVLA